MRRLGIRLVCPELLSRLPRLKSGVKDLVDRRIFDDFLGDEEAATDDDVNKVSKAAFCVQNLFAYDLNRFFLNDIRKPFDDARTLIFENVSLFQHVDHGFLAALFVQPDHLSVLLLGDHQEEGRFEGVNIGQAHVFSVCLGHRGFAEAHTLANCLDNCVLGRGIIFLFDFKLAVADGRCG